MEYGQYGFQVYRIPKGDLLIGKTGWQELKTFDAGLTGYESNFLPGVMAGRLRQCVSGQHGDDAIFPSFANVRVA
jgi:hypothetical protein